jgi:hypothetical protein
MDPQEDSFHVIPAKAGNDNYFAILDPRLRGDDSKDRFQLFNKSIKAEGDWFFPSV